MSRILDLGNGFVQVDDYIIEKDVLGIIERIRAYDPNLEVMYLNPERGGLLDEPWVIVEHCPDGLVRKVFGVWEMNESVMERLIKADTWKTDVLLGLDKVNEVARIEQQRQFNEKKGESSDKLKHLLASPKTTYTLPNSEGQIITVDDHTGVTKREE